ncbi:MAG TPA: hypothetical protein VFI84_01525 [Candidatus Saccharimonadales bacterium]|nr:hypothetical protein [Candidatus Saccharimonadales bacterium]
MAPVGAAVAMVEWGPEAHVNVAGMDLGVRTEIGQATSHADLLGGLVTLDMPYHKTLLGKSVGVRATADVSKNGDGQTNSIEGMAEQLYEIKPEEKRIADAVVWHDIRFGGGAFLGVLTAEALIGGAALSNKRDLSRRKPEEQVTIESHVDRWPKKASRIGSVALACTLSASGLWVVASGSSYQSLHTEAVFANTPLSPLDNMQVGGALGESVVQEAKTIQVFYDRATANALVATHKLFGAGHLSNSPNVVSWLVSDDYQGRSGMEQVVGSIAKQLDPTYSVIDGDVSATGSKYETQTVDTYRYYAGSKATILAARGRHDSADTMTLMRKAGFVVADGKAHTLNGLSYIGFNDAWRSPFGQPDYLFKAGLTEQSIAVTVLAETCRTQPFFVFGHDSKDIGSQLAQSLCPRIVFDGRSYDLLPDRIYTNGTSTTIEVTSPSTGAHGHGDGFEIGTINNPARFKLIRYYKDTDTFTENLFTLNTDATMSISPETPITSANSEVVRVNKPVPEGKPAVSALKQLPRRR